MDEDEDKVLLSSLGVASANPEDIERSIFAEAKKETANEEGGSGEEEPLDDLERTGSASTSHSKLLNKLRAVDFEIHAVASTVEQAGEAVAADDLSFDGDVNVEKGKKEDAWTSRSGSALQHALATDRLRSLRKTKALLEQELSGFQEAGPSKTVENYKLLQNLVKEEPTKRKLKEVKKPGKREGKKLKTVSFHDDPDFDAALDAASAGFVETERDELVRRGILTPFHKLKGFERGLQRPGPSDRCNVPIEEDEIDNLASGTIAKAVHLMSEAAKARPTTKLLESNDLPKLDAPTIPFKRLRKAYKNPNSSESEVDWGKDSKTKKRRPLPEKKWRKRITHEDNDLQESVDGPVNMVDSSFEEDQVEDVHKIDDHETSYVLLEGGLKIPESIYSKLFDYQKVGVQWLWELHCQRAGGIIGDEMGLGKTVQVLSFLGSLHFSKMYKPSIVICPVTLLRQWKREARTWYPSFHVEILHDSAQDSVRRKKQEKSSESDYDTEDSAGSDYEQKLPSKINNKWDSLIDRVLRSESGLLITTYEQIRLLGEKLLDFEWGYAVLDEGHRIRNPNAEVTLVCKQLQTVHRVIMTGAPIQNKLTELWSLFDFVFPGKLGVLPVFEAEFAVPITVGGYANASPLQVSTAYRCAVVLRDLIMPYLLRRMKADVNAQLPKKTEHVLFCSLTEEQRSIYRAFLASSEVENILDGSKNSLYGIDVMRKICNHPDLLERDHSHQNPDYGNHERSGKMKVVEQVLKVWKEQGHRVLFFAQTQQMLDILESFLVASEYSYRRMDGSTPVKHRMALIDEFNNSEEVFVFILTTKVGGLGTNLTGANRVIIFDPDWNPSTDMQARERAWRIGQKKDVTIYRLITRGTIEEKVYHRQIYKHFLTNKILKNPQQRRFFKARDMKDLFTLNDNGDSNGSTETSNIFNQLSEDINVLGGDRTDDERDKRKNSKGAGNSAADAMEGSSRIKEDADKRENAEDETNILKCLFDNHGIHSAVNHDVIMDAHVEEKTRLEAQATQVAQRAAEALRQSRMVRSHDSISVPTWTGKSGTAGAPSSVRKKFGSSVNSQLTRSIGESPAKNGLSAGSSSGKALSSAEVLARIRGNHEKAASAGLEPRPPNLTSVQPEVLIRKICSFIQQRGGRTASSSIVEHFQDRIPAKDLPLFKNLLKEIATLEKDPNGSLWVLKPEYREE